MAFGSEEIYRRQLTRERLSEIAETGGEEIVLTIQELNGVEGLFSCDDQKHDQPIHRR